MGVVGFHITGRYGNRKPISAKAWFKKIIAWLNKLHRGEPVIGTDIGVTDDGDPCLALMAHPAAPPALLSVPRAGRVLATAETFTTGPGYHVFLCDLLRRMGDALGITWDDPDADSKTGDYTGYFYAGDRVAVEREMLEALKRACKIICRRLAGKSRALEFSMPPGGPTYDDTFGPVLTPMGPRGRAWCAAVVADPVEGLDFFPWWEPGIGADFLIGRAVHQMWNSVRWRRPITKTEYDGLMKLHLDLCRAYALDKHRAYPWREWQEVIGQVKGEGAPVPMWDEDLEPLIRRRAARAKKGPLIGYRRKPVRVPLLAGWSVMIPGEMAEEWDEEGDWYAFTRSRAVWIRMRTLRDGKRETARKLMSELKLDETWEPLGSRKGKLRGRAVFGATEEEDGMPVWQLAAGAAVPGEALLCTISTYDPADRDWAISVWQSLEHQTVVSGRQ